MRDRLGIPGQLSVPVNGGWIDSRVPAIAQELHALDPRLTLEARCDSTRQVVCYDLFERLPDGRESWVTRWPPDEVDRILHDVHLMRRDSPSHRPVTETVREAHQHRQSELDRQMADTLAEFADRVEGVRRDQGGADWKRRQFDFNGDGKQRR